MRVPSGHTSLTGDTSAQKITRALHYSPLREKGSTTFFLIPFFPFERRLFYKTVSMVQSSEEMRDVPCQRPWLLISGKKSTTVRMGWPTTGTLRKTRTADQCCIAAYTQHSSPHSHAAFDSSRRLDPHAHARRIRPNMQSFLRTT